MGELFHTEKRDITQDDRDQLGKDLARVNIAMDSMEDEQGSMNRAFRVKLRQLKEQKKTISRQLDAGIVELRFAVEEVPDDSRMVIQVLRADTKELLTTRPMNEAEKVAANARKQVDMFEDGSTEPHDTEPAPPRRKFKSIKGGGGTKKKNGKK